MKKFLLLLLLVGALAHSAYAQDNQPAPAGKAFLIPSVMGGYEAVTGLHSNDTEHNGFLYGFGLRYIDPDPGSPFIGGGYTYFSSTLKDDIAAPGIAKNTISGHTLDLMIALKNTSDYFAYMVVSAGKGSEKFSPADPNMSWKADSLLVGYGVGVLEKPSENRRIIAGAEIRYLTAPELQNVSAFLQVLFSVGYAF